MFVLVGVLVVAVVLGLAAGGSFRGFDDVRLRWWPLALLGLAMQLVPVTFLDGAARDRVEVAMLVGSFAPLFAFVWANRRLAGWWLIGLGLLSNLVVIAANGGMPVTRDAIVASGQGEHIDELAEGNDPKHHLADDDDVLLFLADVIPVPRPVGQVVSPGDLVLYAGVGWLVVGVMRGRSRRSAAAPGPASTPAGPPPSEPPGATTSGTGP